jgi:hypothetical protein
LEALSFDVAHFQVDFPVFEAERRNVAIAVKGYVLRMWRYVWINSYSIEGAVDLWWNVAQDNEVCHLALNAARQVRPVEIFGNGPFGIQARTILLIQ